MLILISQWLWEKSAIFSLFSRETDQYTAVVIPRKDLYHRSKGRHPQRPPLHACCCLSLSMWVYRNIFTTRNWNIFLQCDTPSHTDGLKLRQLFPSFVAPPTHQRLDLCLAHGWWYLIQSELFLYLLLLKLLLFYILVTFLCF